MPSSCVFTIPCNSWQTSSIGRRKLYLINCFPFGGVHHCWLVVTAWIFFGFQPGIAKTYFSRAVITGRLGGSHLLSAPTLIVFAYHSILALCKCRHSLLFRIAVIEHCVYDLLVISTCTVTVDPVDNLATFEGTATFTEPGLLLS